MRKRIAVFTIVLSCLFFLTALITSLLQKSPLFFAIAIQFAAIGIISSHFLFHAQWRQDLISAIQAGRGESAKQMNLLKEQFDALLNIFFVLRPEKPLPTMSRWAAEPDFIKLLIHLLLKEKPKNIVEAGSGVSTLCMALAIHRYKLSSSILSLEHDQRCFDQTMNSLREHGISDHVNLVYAPLKKYELKGKNMLWYETKGLQQISDIDMLVIDGPPAIQDPLARFPAIPLLDVQMTPQSIIILDDYSRAGEQSVVASWLEAFPHLRLFKHDTLRGAAILRRDSFATQKLS